MAAGLVAAILGAPWFRASFVFALVAAGVGSLQLYKPQAWLALGRVRAGSMIYSGVGALIFASAINASPSPSAVVPARAGGHAQTLEASSSQPAAGPVSRSIYPWAYTVSRLTLSCQKAEGEDRGGPVASTDDGRVFAFNQTTQSPDRPNISAIQKRGGNREEVRQAAADLAAAAQQLCDGDSQARLIASEGEAPPPPPPPPSAWEYRTDIDAMTDGRTSFACTISTDVVELGFPYETQHVSLCLRQHPRWGQDVIVRLERGGQFICTSYDGCTVRVRFGDGAPAAYSANEPADNSSDTLFISNDARFISNVKRVSRVIIEANFYQAGAQRMTFETGQLEWPPRP